MSKSILVIDTPKNCYKCPLLGGFYCEIANKNMTKEGRDKRPDWCPLQEMPEKKEYDPAMPVTKQWGYEFTNGYNYCIDEILKEVFENPIPYSGDNIGSRD